MYKIEFQEENGIWRDVRDEQGRILMFENEEDARAKLKDLFPIIVQMEKYAGGKRTRVIRVWDPAEDEDWS